MDINFETSVDIVWGLIFNHAIKSQLAWKAPRELKSRLQITPFSLKEFISLGVDGIEYYIARKPALHRFPNRMANYLYFASKTIVDEYNGDPRKLWEQKNEDEIIDGFSQLKGINHHKACIGLIVLNLINPSIGCSPEKINTVSVKCTNFFDSIHASLDSIIE
jgi:endonuclease-3